jgi:hypothetical protein
MDFSKINAYSCYGGSEGATQEGDGDRGDERGPRRRLPTSSCRRRTDDTAA